MRTLALLFLLAGCASMASAVTPRAGDLLVADPQAAGVGEILLVDPTSGAQTPIVTGRPFAGVTVASDGSVWATAASEVGRVDLEAGTFTPVSSGGELQYGMGMSVDDDGSLLVADQFAFSNCGSGGHVLRIDPVSGAQAIVLCIHFHPIDVVAEAGDSAVAVSEVAGLVRFNPTSGAASGGFSGYRIFVFSNAFFKPRGIAIQADGNLVCTSFPDTSLLNHAVVRVDRLTGAREEVTSGGYLTWPAGIAVAADGSYLIADERALPDGTGSAGAVVRVDPLSGAQTVVSSGGWFQSPHGIAVYGVRNGIVPAVSTTWGRLKERYR